MQDHLRPAHRDFLWFLLLWFQTVAGVGSSRRGYCSRCWRSWRCSGRRCSSPAATVSTMTAAAAAEEAGAPGEDDDDDTATTATFTQWNDTNRKLLKFVTNFWGWTIWETKRFNLKLTVLLEMIANSDLRHGLEFDFNLEAMLFQGKRPLIDDAFKLHLAMIASSGAE